MAQEFFNIPRGLALIHGTAWLVQTDFIREKGLDKADAEKTQMSHLGA